MYLITLIIYIFICTNSVNKYQSKNTRSRLVSPRKVPKSERELVKPPKHVDTTVRQIVNFCNPNVYDFSVNRF